jgi:hypothetical protein
LASSRHEWRGRRRGVGREIGRKKSLPSEFIRFGAARHLVYVGVPAIES